jgi:apolipoprotein N-acyltransferase
MNSPVWQIVGYVGVAGYVLAVALIFVGNHLAGSKQEKNAKLGLFLLAALGGPGSAWASQAELDRRRKTS